MILEGSVGSSEGRQARENRTVFNLAISTVVCVATNCVR